MSFNDLMEKAKQESETVATVAAAVRMLLRKGYKPHDLGFHVQRGKKPKKAGGKKKAADEYSGGEYDMFTVPDTILEPVADEHLDETLIYDNEDDE